MAEQFWEPVRQRLAQSASRWSVKVVDLDAPASALLSWQPAETLRTASIGKLALLAAASAAIDSGEVDAGELLIRQPAGAVADSGVWQHLRVETLPLDDVARLVGLVSDNWATNTLLFRLGGVGAVSRAAHQWGIHDLELLDQVRDIRTSAHPETLSRSSAEGCIDFWHTLTVEGAGRRAERVRQWLSDGLDTSMVPSGLGLDPLAHSTPTFGLTLIHKTGTDDAIRADTGILSRGRHRVAYACISNAGVGGYSGGREQLDEDLAIMRDLGLRIDAYLRARVTRLED